MRANVSINMEVYHGTSQEFADRIVGPPNGVDVSKGRGELGMGFYAGGEPSLAAALARGRHNTKASVLQLSLDVKEFLKMDILPIMRAREVREKWGIMRLAKTTTTHQFGVDVVTAPFATIEISHQYKFESNKAELFLNNSVITKVL